MTITIDSIVTDPPYELGFMGKKWDSTGIAYNVELWKECLRVLKPGGHLLAFGGTRTYHRMACAIEDAGFEIRDSIQYFFATNNMAQEFVESLTQEQSELFWRLLDTYGFAGQMAWIYGSGFPKSMDISKAIDKKAGVKREGIIKTNGAGVYIHSETINDGRSKQAIANSKNKRIYETGVPVTHEAQLWDGWGTCLKPANEPIVLARKPISEKTVADNVLKWGTGGLNIDGCRVPVDPAVDDMLRTTTRGKRQSETWEQGSGFKNENNSLTGVRPEGRFPANVILDEEAGRMLDEQQEGASRFFYVAKASRSERTHGGKVENNHPTVKPLKLMRYLCRLITPPGGTVLDPFAGSGTTLIAAVEEGFSVIGIEREPEYCEIIRKRMAEAQPALPLVR